LLEFIVTAAKSDLDEPSLACPEKRWLSFRLVQIEFDSKQMHPIRFSTTSEFLYELLMDGYQALDIEVYYKEVLT